MAKRKVTQDDLRKMMAQVKTTKASASTGPASKKYKLSSRELALLEEKKREDESKRAKERERKAAALAGLPKPDAVPQKSILKNKPTNGDFTFWIYLELWQNRFEAQDFPELLGYGHE